MLNDIANYRIIYSGNRGRITKAIDNLKTEKQIEYDNYIRPQLKIENILKKKKKEKKQKEKEKEKKEKKEKRIKPIELDVNTE